MKKNISVKTILATLVISSTCLLTACATSDLNLLVSDGSAVSTGAKLKAINPQKVKVYDKAPRGYTAVGRVSAENYTIVGMEHSQESIYKELKAQAASIGANGILDVTPGMATTTAKAIRIR